MAVYVEKWLDYANGWPSGAAVRAAGFTGTIRYTTAPRLMNPPGKNQKHITKKEYDDHRANGVKVRLVFQGGTTDADGGWSLGVANAKLALEGANYLGYAGVIFFCNDRTTLPSPSAWQSYLDGAASVLGVNRVGAYGFANALNAAKGHASAFWQAGRESDLQPHANYYQWNNGRATVSGVSCDINYVIKDYDLGANVSLDGNDFNLVWYNAVSTIDGVTYNAASLLEDLFKSVNELQEAVAGLQTGGVDVTALATAVATQLNATVAKAVADELKNRLAN